MNDRLTVRKFEPRDRAAVRQICCDTADRGEPVENFFPDRELIADLVIGYYTDCEPESSWVAENDGQVVGYLTGSLDSGRCSQQTMRVVVPRAIRRGLGRGLLWQRAAWRLGRAAWQTWRRGGWPRRLALDEYPAHVHINVQTAFRGRQVGRLLAEQFFAQARQAGCSGVHANVRGDNAAGCGFFERLGFVPLARYPLVLPNGAGYLTTSTVVYGKRL